jgi:hypothetical protein
MSMGNNGRGWKRRHKKTATNKGYGLNVKRRDETKVGAAINASWYLN